MNIGELKKLIKGLDNKVEIEIYIESGFSSSSSGGKYLNGYFDEEENKLVLEGEEVNWE